MGNPALEVVFILVLIVANGVFSMAESAVVASRKARLQHAAQAGDAKAKAALALAENPNRFFSTVQIGITLIGILSGAFGGATLSKSLAVLVKRIPSLASYADSISFGVVVFFITYLSLVIGELVPKRLALGAPEKIAGIVAKPMGFVSLIGAPFVTLLTFSTDLVLRLLGVKDSDEAPVTEEEIKVMVEQGTQAGVFHVVEQDIIQRVFALGDRDVDSIMTRRPDVVWIDSEAPLEDNRHKLSASAHSRVVVCRGDLDHVLGIVRAKDLLEQSLEGKPLDFMAALHKPLYVPESLAALKLLQSMKGGRTHMAIVVDEHGGTQGLVTLHDIMSAVVGEMPSSDDHNDSDAVQRDDGTWLVDGMIALEEFKEIFHLDELPAEKTGSFSTLSGFILNETGRVPAVSDHFEAAGLRFEVMDMDGQRIDKVLVTPLNKEEEAP